MFIQNNKQTKTAVYDGKMQIKGRGNSTWFAPKKPYKLKLAKKTDLYGMGKNKHWVLLANYIDESLMRNTIAGNLSKELGLVNMETVWADVIMNGNYVGNYQLCEHIRIGDSRVDIGDWETEAEDMADKIGKAAGMAKEEISGLEDKMKEDLSWVSTGRVEYSGTDYDISSYGGWNKDISGGYLFEMDSFYDEISKFQTKRALPVMINSPEYLYTNAEMMEYAQEYWNAFEDAYYSEDGYTKYNGKKTHYSQLADLDSMIGYWLTMEIMGNNDAVWRSRYAYKDRAGKLYFGPVWDFDWGCGSFTVGEEAVGWKITLPESAHNFYAQFVDDPYFLQKAAEKYWQVRPYLESLICDNGIFDDTYEYLYESGVKNSEKWFCARGFEQDFHIFKNYMKQRIAWLDEQFETEKSITESVYTIASANPYIKSENALAIELNTAEDTVSAHAPASGIIRPQTDVETFVTVNDDRIKKLCVYVNGLEYGTYGVENGEVNFTVEVSVLTQNAGTKNIISLLGKDDDEKTIFTNFASVIVAEEAVNAIRRVVISGLEVPKGGKAFDTMADCTFASIDTGNLGVTWTRGEEQVSGTARYNTDYTANMILKVKPSSDPTFTDKTKVTINGLVGETKLNADGSLSVKFYFHSDRAKLLEIAEAPKIEIANGIVPHDIKLPGTVGIVTEDKNITKADVEWDIENIEGYDCDVISEQDFIINGKLICPDEIDTDGKTLLVPIAVHALAAEAIYEIKAEGLNNPVPEKVLDTAINCTDSKIQSISVEWKQEGLAVSAAASYNKKYTAHITLKAERGYCFTDATKIKVNGAETAVLQNKGKTIVVEKDFMSRKAKLISVKHPDEIRIESGILPEDIKLPGIVDIVTEDKDITKAGVEWDVKNIKNYNPGKLSKQEFEIDGTIIYPEIDAGDAGTNISIKVVAYFSAAIGGDVLEDDIPKEGIVPEGFWIADVKDIFYTGKKIIPPVHVYYGKKRLTEGDDYTISYKNNTNANDASNANNAPTVIVKGKWNYHEVQTITFKILPMNLNDSSITAEDICIAYNGKLQKKVPSVLYNGKKLSDRKDIAISYTEKAADAYKATGTYGIVLTAKAGSNFTGSRTVRLTITDKKLIEKASIKKIPDKAYTGNAIEPELKVAYKNTTLVRDKDYTVIYFGNTSTGTASVVITGIGEYVGTKKATFKIIGTPIKNAKVTGIANKVYNSYSQKQNISVMLGGKVLTEGEDYEVEYTYNAKAGQAVMIIKGINAYTGSIKKTFRISAYDLAKDTEKLVGGIKDDITVEYVKGGCKPKIELTFAGKVLMEGRDYTISYRNNKAAAAANSRRPPSFTIKGKGNFKGTITRNFSIIDKPIQR